MKKVLLAGAMAAAALTVAPSAMAAPGGGVCQLHGTANFTTPLGATDKAFGYTFGGTLSGCQSNESGAPAGGTVGAGVLLSANGEDYQMPVASGTGSCGHSTTSGIALISWADGTKTLIDYTTNGAAVAIALTGSVRPSITLPPLDGAGPALTITSNRYTQSTVAGPLAFTTDDPAACGPTGSGLNSATIDGVQSLGHS